MDACTRCEAVLCPKAKYCHICNATQLGVRIWFEVKQNRSADWERLAQVSRFRVDKFPDKLRLCVKNIGRASVELMRVVVVSRPESIELDSREALGGTLNLVSSEQVALNLDFETDWLKSLLQTTSVKFTIGDASLDEDAQPLEVRVFPEPVLEIVDPQPFQILLDGESNEEHVLSVRASKGECRIIGKPSVKGGADWLSVGEVRNAPAQLNACDDRAHHAQYIFDLEVNETIIIDNNISVSSQRPTLEFAVQDGLDQTDNLFIGGVRFFSTRPQTLKVSHLIDEESGIQLSSPVFHKVTAGIPDEIELILENIGDANLHVESIACSCQEFCVENSSFILLPRESRRVSVQVGEDAFKGCESKRVVEAQIIIHSNDPKTPLHVSLEYDVLPLESSEDYLIVDFGTSSTVSAVGKTEQKLDKIHFVDHPSKAINSHQTPTEVYYRDRDHQFIGVTASAQSGNSPFAIQKSFKTNLGEEGSRRVWLGSTGDWIRRTPQEITSDFLNQYFQGVKKSIKKATPLLYLTHPVKFSLKQRGILSSVVTDLLHGSIDADDESIELWTEPEAGSLEYMLERLRDLKAGEEESYHLLVYDFGGGTTDVSLLLVEANKKQETPYLDWKLLGLTGELHLGGDDLTKSLFDQMLPLIERGLLDQAREDPSVNGEISVPFTSCKEFAERRSMIVNRSSLSDIAESYKVQRSRVDAELGEGWGLATESVLQRLKRDSNKLFDLSRSEDGVFDQLKIKQQFDLFIGGTSCEIELMAPIRLESKIAHFLEAERIEKCVDKAYRLWNQYQNTDVSELVILPIGQSSAYPCVKEYLHRAFSKRRDWPTWKWYEGLKFKDCVASGLAAFLACRHELRGPRLDPDNHVHSISQAFGWEVDGRFVSAISIGDQGVDVSEDGWTFTRYPIYLRRPVVKIQVLTESPLEGLIPDHRESLPPIKAMDFFSIDELREGLEVALAMDRASELHIRLRAGGRVVNPKVVNPKEEDEF
jgi:hypothetical protein